MTSIAARPPLDSAAHTARVQQQPALVEGPIPTLP
jgi:hypothetical protein